MQGLLRAAENWPFTGQCTHMCMYTYTHCTHSHSYIQHTHMHTHVLYTHAQHIAHTFTCTHSDTYAHAYILSHTCICTFTCTHTHTCTYTGTHACSLITKLFEEQRAAVHDELIPASSFAGWAGGASWKKCHLHRSLRNWEGALGLERKP